MLWFQLPSISIGVSLREKAHSVNPPFYNFPSSQVDMHLNTGHHDSCFK